MPWSRARAAALQVVVPILHHPPMLWPPALVIAWWLLVLAPRPLVLFPARSVVLVSGARRFVLTVLILFIVLAVFAFAFYGVDSFAVFAILAVAGGFVPLPVLVLPVPGGPSKSTALGRLVS